MIFSINWSKIYSESFGPGDASEWYWIEKTGRVLWHKPEIVPSLRFKWVISSWSGIFLSETA